MSQPTHTLVLTRDHTRRLCLPRGSTLVAVRGSVRLLTPPNWLSERVWQLPVLLHEGQAHQLEHGGWLSLCAQGDAAELLCLPAAPPAWWPALLAVRRLLLAGRGARWRAIPPSPPKA